MHVSIEVSKSGKTFGVAIHKSSSDKPFMVIKGCRLAYGQNGPFVSGPSTKMDDGKWFNYLFMDKAFGDYATKLAVEAMPDQDTTQSNASTTSDDIPF